MTPGPDTANLPPTATDGETKRRRRAVDHPVVVATRQLGFPIVIAFMLFYAGREDRREERKAAERRDERTAVAFAELRRSIDASTDASRLATAELRTVGERVADLGGRVDRLEQLGARVMERRRSPTP